MVHIGSSPHYGFINTFVISFLQGGERYKFPSPNPFVEEDADKSEVASVAYRYVLLMLMLMLMLFSCLNGETGPTFHTRYHTDLMLLL